VPRGKPLTPEQVEAASEVYNRTGNYSEAGKAIGVERWVAREALLRRGDPQRHTLHARALARGAREGAKAIRYGLTKARERFDQAADGSEFASVMKATTDGTRTLAALAAQADERKAAKLARQKARAEIKALQQSQAGNAAARLILPDYMLRPAADEGGGAGQALPPEREAGTVPPRSS
jgi:hypothetical protein